ncbi:hypothetical protein HBA53_15575 [Rhodococcus pyridinivorans]|uniref:hypothetical protein n=1 Tax=Rhodococcus pyridinivorans TaxID=103816 RepID=UPI001C309112|nr:hypothetical protein [Rhodococcus pyridinivorans]QXF82289.1 hypothetical protein HBA53_15575 [Rhodococcus pyridinivorans]
MNDPTLVPRDALLGRRVAVSVSGSADLGRLGLTSTHLELVVAEITRAVILAGGTVVYGGRIQPAGFTQIILDEVARFGGNRKCVELYVPISEHKDTPIDVLEKIDQRLGNAGRLYLLTVDGQAQSVSKRRQEGGIIQDLDAAEGLTAMRKRVSADADARIILGGKLSGFQGAEPGVIEEARFTLQAGKSLYVAGGYGGAAAAVAKVLGFDHFDWAPPAYPAHADSHQVQSALSYLRSVYESVKPVDGLTQEERQVLAVSHRPANIATAVVSGLAKVQGSNREES